MGDLSRVVSESFESSGDFDGATFYGSTIVRYITSASNKYRSGGDSIRRSSRPDWFPEKEYQEHVSSGDARSPEDHVFVDDFTDVYGAPQTDPHGSPSPSRSVDDNDSRSASLRQQSWGVNSHVTQQLSPSRQTSKAGETSPSRKAYRGLDTADLGIEGSDAGKASAAGNLASLTSDRASPIPTTSTVGKSDDS